MAKGNNSRNTAEDAGPASNGGKRNTHFLCFPISSKKTIAQLSQSLTYFKTIATAPESGRPERRLRQNADGRFEVVTDIIEVSSQGQESLIVNLGEERGSQTISADGGLPRDDLPEGTTSNNKSFADSLRVLPASTHRSAGTYHLTIGVMDLSDSAQMLKAQDLIQSLDLQQMLGEASKGPPSGTKAARKWADKDTKEHGSMKIEKFANTHSDGKAQEPSPSNTGVESLERVISPPLTTRQQPAVSMTPSPLYISLTGLGSFPSVKKARVIWARPRGQLPPSSAPEIEVRPIFDESEQDRLYNFALHLNTAFRDAGLIFETRPLVLHATVANMRYVTQAKKGRTSKGRAWTHGKKRWQEGLVDVRPLAQVFNEFGGSIEAASAALTDHTDTAAQEGDGKELEQAAEDDATHEIEQEGDEGGDASKEYVWVEDVMIDRVAICKMGATKAEDPMWGEWYPPVAEKRIFPG